MTPLKLAATTFSLAVGGGIVLGLLVLSPFDVTPVHVVGYSVILSALLITSILAFDAAIPNREEWPIEKVISVETVTEARAVLMRIWK